MTTSIPGRMGLAWEKMELRARQGWCECRHSAALHADVNGQGFAELGHGFCHLCACDRFTFVSFEPPQTESEGQ